MTRSKNLWFGVAAVATLMALLGIAVLALVVGRNLGDGLALAISIATSVATAFFCVFVADTAGRQRVGRRDPPNLSIKHELDLRKVRAKGARIQFR